MSARVLCHMDASDTIIYVSQKAQTVPGQGRWRRDASPATRVLRFIRGGATGCVSVRTPTRCHIGLACNTSYHFAASRTVFPRVSPYLARDRLRLLTHVYDSVASIHMTRTPTRCHIDLAGNTSYHFAASCTVSPRVSPYLYPGPFAPFGSRI